MEKVRVIVVDDSAFMRKAISDMIESCADFEVIAKFRDGRELVEKVDKFNPDLITLDVHMRDLDGLATLKELKRMGKNYPIIMLSSATTEGSELTLECLDNGAITFITKPSGSISLDIDKVKERLIDEIKGITSNIRVNKSSNIHMRQIASNKESEIENKINDRRVNTHFSQRKEIDNSEKPSPMINNKVIPKNKKIDAVVIGASTGGPKALQQVLTKLPANLNVPVFVVQHMPEGFTKVFAERLNKVCNLNVTEAEDGMSINRNTIYIAKGGSHMIIDSSIRVSLNKEPSIWGVRPAVDKLFESASKVYGGNLLSVVLTGMGKDGAEGSKRIKDCGGITISEDKSTCTIYGMPKAAYETGKIDLVLPLDQICNKIAEIVKGI
ncbi:MULTISPECIES: protein-glutamate methylesterase/protein-glutamine glutaminase [Clostridium]|uniref:Protein-glutamate methylesterase/protein-glutamine glutaminase n=1 Tax=Clostridium butyricum TaxID=1492 RepID=A0AAP9RHB3_CLOBU|nr:MULTISPECIES: chemotaxis response regulator protein-glutamate methylesterase [Clostridium]AXB85929.1 chemotaxis response regulator protein-glutamate methylesterase [Clostridium butyricum]EMU53528.1 chemotaxis response regulator protein-glutamate methylesterase [Clostridium butyricum DKU-01]KJZ82783.1 Chemotaxis response regulator proteinglutamate methylesterase CheB [Clostridium sp. IBUN22A]KQB77385.1 chemotaxis protein CheY [Clostridium butyricum]MBS4840301.1 chemotaxis response regulator 